jgi:hypothetical protein
VQTVTIGIAQMNMLYGDWTAHRIFNLLWKTDEAEHRFYTAAELTELEHKATDDSAKAVIENRTKALGILGGDKQGNPYLKRNMLMYALDRSCKLSGSGQQIAYEHAIDFLLSATQSPDSALKAIFGQSWEFGIGATPIGNFSDGSKYAAAEKECIENRQKKECSRFPVAKILGLSIPLPSPEEFNDRDLTYPTVLHELLAAREKLATRLTDYEIFDWAGADHADASQYKETLAKALIEANR